MSDSVRCRKKLLLVAVVCLGISALFTTTRELRFCWYVAAASVAWLGWYALLECDCFYCALFTGRLFEPPKRHTPTDVVKEPAQAEALAVSTSTFAPSWVRRLCGCSLLDVSLNSTMFGLRAVAASCVPSDCQL
jgi:hypothetical protein